MKEETKAHPDYIQWLLGDNTIYATRGYQWVEKQRLLLEGK